jgi:tripartite-type tricarboxylate transporter receptor subunit TctC
LTSTLSEKERRKKMKYCLKILVPVMALGLLLGISGVDRAYGEYPEKMITYVVPFGAGGGTDRLARILSSAAMDSFGQPWHVVNIPGASGIVGWKDVLKRPADGYTILQSSSTPVIALTMEEKPALSPDQIKIACYVAGFRAILTSKPGTEWSTWEKFKAYAKKNPGKITVAGTMSNLIGVANMCDQAGLKVNYVPYPSTGKAVADFLGGHVDTFAATASTVGPLIPKKGVAVVNTSDVPIPKKVKEFQGVPGAKDLGYKGMFFPRWVGVHPDTPDKIVDAISEKMGKLTKHKSVVRLFKKVGEEITYLTRAEAEAAYKDMVKSVKKTVKLLQ